jgi:hypothetical protein
MKYPAIGTVRQQPEPRPQHQPVTIIVLLSADFAADPLRVGKDAAEEALLLLIGLELNGASLADRLVEVDVLLFAQGVDMKLERLAQHFVARKTPEDQHIVPEWRLERCGVVRLTELSHPILATSSRTPIRPLLMVHGRAS